MSVPTPRPTFQFVRPRLAVPQDGAALTPTAEAPSPSARDFLLPGGQDSPSLDTPSSGDEPASTPIGLAHGASGTASPGGNSRFTSPLNLPSPLQRAQSGRATGSTGNTPLLPIAVTTADQPVFSLTSFHAAAPSATAGTGVPIMPARHSGFAPSPSKSLFDTRPATSSTSSSTYVAPSPFANTPRNSGFASERDRSDRSDRSDRDQYGSGREPHHSDDENAPLKGLGKSIQSTYYEQYEATVNKIRLRRSQEAAEKALAGRRAPDQTKRELRVVGMLLALVLAVVAVIIFVLYPRVPLWSVSRVDITEMRLWSDGTAEMSLSTHFDVLNSNFMSTGIESVEIDVKHNQTILGTVQPTDTIKLRGRKTNSLSYSFDFSPLDVTTFGELFQELLRTNGQLTLDYDIAVITSENFRLRNIQMACTAVLQLSAKHVPPTAVVKATHCTHQEQTG